MNVKLYTDENYIPLEDLTAFGLDFVEKTKKYRRSFMEIVSLDGLNFVNIVETPSLVKKRFSKNVDLKGVVNITAENNDFILEMAKSIAQKRAVEGIHLEKQELIYQKYIENNKDLTIITNYLINNLEELIDKGDGEIEHLFPQLSKNDMEFISKYNVPSLNYSIGDYQEATNCSYETGRKALEKLEELDLYRKTKVGKKFVYQPTEKLKAIMKGGM